MLYKIKNCDIPEYFNHFVTNPRIRRERRVPNRFIDEVIEGPTLNPRLPVIFTNNRCTRLCLRVYLPELMNGTYFDDLVSEKISTHEIKSFCKYAKQKIIDKYEETCLGCYVCRRPLGP